MNASSDYTPPSSASIKEAQNKPDALRLLIAQRRLHSKAKFWQGLRWIGLLLIGLAAPVVSVIWPSLAVVMGAFAGAWLFLGRTLLSWRVTSLTSQAAATQELFDHQVFGMPSSISRSTAPSIEDIVGLAGPANQIGATAQSEKLLDWYPVEDADDGAVIVAIAQRANASYSDRLLRTAVVVWSSVSAAWLVILAAASGFAGLSATTLMVGVVLPLLPAALDVVEYVVSISKAARDRGDLARSIQHRIEQSGAAIDPADLLVWQGQMYELRRLTPQVPNWLYWATRRRNESAMRDAAQLLANKAKGQR